MTRLPTEAASWCNHNSNAAFGWHEALHSARQHEQVRLPIRCMFLEDLFRRDRNPFFLYPGIPSVFWINVIGRFNFELCFDGVRDPAAEERFWITVAILVVVWPLETLKPSLVWSVRPFTTCKSSVRKANRDYSGPRRRAHARPRSHD